MINDIRQGLPGTAIASDRKTKYNFVQPEHSKAFPTTDQIISGFPEPIDLAPPKMTKDFLSSNYPIRKENKRKTDLIYFHRIEILSIPIKPQIIK